MPEETKSPDTKETAPQLEGGTYEIIRKRLNATGAELRGRLNKLNDARKQVTTLRRLQLAKST